MSAAVSAPKRVAIACGGTGGHLFPGLAVAEVLKARGCAITLLVSPKEVDQQAVRSLSAMDIVTLPAVGMVRGHVFEFFRGFKASYQVARSEFLARRPGAVLAMGGFTSAPPVLAGKRLGARTFLHESNSLPGRANRWLSWLVDFAFTGFPDAGRRLHAHRVKVTGTPVRSTFSRNTSESCRRELGLDTSRPLILIMGGSQGASGINEFICQNLPLFKAHLPAWQWFHLTGDRDFSSVKAAYESAGLSAHVERFCSRMELALGAADVCISRAGASSLAELAQMEVPSVLVPYPAAMDNHQYFNARAYVQAGAALLVEQNQGPQVLADSILRLASGSEMRYKMRAALRLLQRPQAASEIVEILLAGIADPVCLQNPFSEKGNGPRSAPPPEVLEQRGCAPAVLNLRQESPPA